MKSKPTDREVPDLFNSAAEKSEVGYHQWRSEMEAARAAEKATTGIATGELPCGGDASGYERFREDMDEARRAFERRWGVPVGHRARVTLLRDEDEEIEGVLNVVEPLLPTKKQGLMLVINGRQFRAVELASVVRL